MFDSEKKISEELLEKIIDTAIEAVKAETGCEVGMIVTMAIARDDGIEDCSATNFGPEHHEVALKLLARTASTIVEQDLVFVPAPRTIIVEFGSGEQFSPQKPPYPEH